MNKIYKQLAQHLDKIPNGFPATESGVELKILARLFTAEEAEIACAMSLEPESPEIIAERLGWEKGRVYKSLKEMVKNGLIGIERGKGGFRFKLIPFIVGFYERQNAEIDQKFARLFEDYYHQALYKMMTVKPSVHRIIPIEKNIQVNIEVIPYERVSTYIENSKSWGVLKCICRVQKELIGEGCDHTKENCLVLSSRSRQFDRVDAIRSITKEKALDILEQAEKEGLIHSVNNVQEGVDYICNCCSCCCGVLRGMIEYGSPHAVAGSDFLASVDDSLCNGCGVCLERCQFQALSLEDDVCEVRKDKCMGCGLCVSTCPTQALHLIQKRTSEPPPRSEAEWREQRSASRKTE
ncbi:MAG: 4Fe-4S binding protein [bacterium]